MNYSIALGKKETSNKRHILWCDEHWYETTGHENFAFTLEQAKAVVKQLIDHYQYFVSLVGEDGSISMFEFGKPEKAAVAPAIVTKSSGLKIKIKF